MLQTYERIAPTTKKPLLLAKEGDAVRMVSAALWIRFLLLLAEGDVAEKLGAVEVGLFGGDGEQRQKVGLLQAVATLIGVAAHAEASEVGEAALEEGADGHDECHVPLGGAFGEGYRLAAERRPAIDAGEHFGWCRASVVAVFARRDEQRAGAVALYIIIRCGLSSPIAALGNGRQRLQEQLAAGVFPHATTVGLGHGAQALLADAVVQ